MFKIVKVGVDAVGLGVGVRAGNPLVVSAEWIGALFEFLGPGAVCSAAHLDALNVGSGWDVHVQAHVGRQAVGKYIGGDLFHYRAASREIGVGPVVEQ